MNVKFANGITIVKSAVVFFVGCVSMAMAEDAKESPAAAKPAAPAIPSITQGTIKVDGDIDAAWEKATVFEVKKPVEAETTIAASALATAKVKLLWDADCLYAIWFVKDPKVSEDGFEHDQDSLELFVDELNDKSSYYQKDDLQVRVSATGKISGAGMEFASDKIKAVAKPTEDGYLVEMSVKLSHAARKPGTKIGLDLQINDNAGTGSRGGITKWHHVENDSYMSPNTFGTVELAAAAE